MSQQPSKLELNLLAWRGPRYLRVAPRRGDLVLVLRQLAAIAKTNASLAAGLSACAEDSGHSVLRPPGGRRSAHPTPAQAGAASRLLIIVLTAIVLGVLNVLLVSTIEEQWRRDPVIAGICAALIGIEVIVVLVLRVRRMMLKRLMQDSSTSAQSAGGTDWLRLFQIAGVTVLVALYNFMMLWFTISFVLGAVIGIAFEVFFFALWFYRNTGARRSRLPRGVSRLVLPPTRVALFLALRAHLNSGHTLSEAMEAMDNFFPAEFTGRMRAAELSGNIVPCLDELADRAVVEAREGQNTAARYFYVLFLVPVQTATIFFILIKVLPVFTEILEEFSSQPPPALRRLIAIGDYFVYNWPWLVVGFCLTVTALTLGYRHIPGVKLNLNRLLLRLPVLGPRLRYHQAAITARILGVLLGAGLPLPEALGVTRRAGLGAALVARLGNCEERARLGASLGECANAIPSAELPPSFRALAALGEQGGCVDETLLHAAAHYEALEKRALHLLRTLTFPLALALPAFLVYTLATAVFESLAAMSDAIIYAL